MIILSNLLLSYAIARYGYLDTRLGFVAGRLYLLNFDGDLGS